jgi:hypothetical protein
MRIVLGVTALLVLTAAADRLAAQEPRLEGRLAGPSREAVEALLDSARVIGLPVEPLVDRALEGSSKGASEGRIVAAVERLFGELRDASAALGQQSAPEEITAGASALRAGAAATDLEGLRQARPGESVTVEAAVLADLVAVGVPVDRAVAAVLALSDVADDADYIAFRSNVERDVALGASPVAALGVRLDAMAAEALTGGRPSADTGPRKP